MKAGISAYTGIFKKHAHMPGSLADQLLRSTCEKDPAMVDDDEAVAHRLYIVDDMSGQKHQPVLCRFRK